MMTSVTRLISALCAAVVLLLPGTLRAQGGPQSTPDLPGVPTQDAPGSPHHELDGFEICAAKQPGAFETSAALLFLQPSSGNLVYSTVVNPFPLLTPHWSDEGISPDFSPAFTVGLRYLFDGCGDIQLDWTHLNTFDSATTHATPPFIPPGPPPTSGPSSTQALGPSFLIGPPPPYASASAVAHFAYDAVNLDAGLLLCAGSHVQLRPFAGIQFARISGSLSTNFRSGDGSISFTDVPQSLFTGAGPRLGLDVHYVAGNFDLLGELAGGALIGSRQSRIDFYTTSPQAAAAGLVPNIQSLTSPDATQVIPCIDAKLGASYCVPVGSFGILKCEAGYQAAVYIGAINQFALSEVENTVVENTEGTAAVFLRTAVETQTNFFVHGPYVKISLRF
jgi:hypothetical protein